MRELRRAAGRTRVTVGAEINLPMEDQRRAAGQALAEERRIIDLLMVDRNVLLERPRHWMEQRSADGGSEKGSRAGL